MKKTMKAVILIALCFAVCCTGVVLAINKNTSRNTGYCNDSQTVTFEQTINDNSTLLITKTTEKSDNADKAAIKDSSVSGDYSDAVWQKYEDVNSVKYAEFKNISIGFGIKIIGKNAFRGQSSLKTLTVSSTVSEIKSGAFEGCNFIEKIVYFGNAETWSKISIGENNPAVFGKTFDELVSEGIIELPMQKDADMNGKIEKADADAIASYCVGESDANLYAADANGDGKVDVSDCVAIMLETK